MGEMAVQAKRLKTALEKLLASGPDEDANLSDAKEGLSEISKACPVIQWGLEEEARLIKVKRVGLQL